MLYVCEKKEKLIRTSLSILAILLPYLTLLSFKANFFGLISRLKKVKSSKKRLADKRIKNNSVLIQSDIFLGFQWHFRGPRTYETGMLSGKFDGNF